MFDGRHEGNYDGKEEEKEKLGEENQCFYNRRCHSQETSGLHCHIPSLQEQ